MPIFFLSTHSAPSLILIKHVVLGISRNFSELCVCLLDRLSTLWNTQWMLLLVTYWQQDVFSLVKEGQKPLTLGKILHSP